MGTPESNPEGYESSSLFKHVGAMQVCCDAALSCFGFWAKGRRSGDRDVRGQYGGGEKEGEGMREWRTGR